MCRRMFFLYRVVLFFCFLPLFSCCGSSYPVDEVLELAGDNRMELEKVLNHYAKEEPDEQKLDAARFLIANMKWHQTEQLIDTAYRMAYEAVMAKADSALFGLFCQQDSLFPSDWMRIAVNETIPALSATAGKRLEPDYRVVRANDLIQGIERAFRFKQQDARLKDLPLEYFYEYLLPSAVFTESVVSDIPHSQVVRFRKYFEHVPGQSSAQQIKTYNRVKQQFSHLLAGPLNPSSQRSFESYWECFNMAYDAASAFRLSGMPVALEQDIAYKQLQGCHYRCALWQDGKWVRFTPNTERNFEEELDDARRQGGMNVYRYTYSAQPGTPYFLKGEQEYVPEEFASPCMKDVTADYVPVVSLTLPFRVGDVPNRVAFLATFNSGRASGWKPVTWGTIRGQEADFRQVVADRLYVLTYYRPGGEQVVVGEPFYVDKEGTVTAYASEAARRTAVVTRKFPCKEELRRKAENLKGALVLGFHDDLKTDIDTIGEIKEVPQPCFQDVELDMSHGPYEGYALETPDGRPLYVAEVQLLPDVRYRYKEVVAANPLPIDSPADTLKAMDALRLTTANENAMNPSQDHDPLTFESYPSTLLFLSRPCYVSRLRFLPINADNAIRPGTAYRLHVWQAGKWEPVGEYTARYNYLQLDLQVGALYWLKDLSGGKEEAPFRVDESGKVRFIYE